VPLGRPDPAAAAVRIQRSDDTVAGPQVEPGPNTDERWSREMVAVQNGDAAAYARLLHGILPFLRAVIRRQHVPHDQIDDVVQDTLLSIHRVRHTYDPSRPLSPWLAAIARHRALDSRRRRAKVETAEVAAPELLATLPDTSASNQVEMDEEHDWLKRAVGTLTYKQREAVELVKLRRLSVAEAASTSGQSPGAIKVNVHRALQALRALYKGG
jgi:RNA polymerase sigma-70 factor, ECF subfamily